MKKISLLLLSAVLFCAMYAQKPFPMVYKSAWPVNVQWRMSNAEKTLALGGDLKEFAMLDATNGNLLWQINFKEKFGAKKANSWSWEHDKNAISLTLKTGDKDVEQTIWIDERSGEKIADISSRKDQSEVKYIKGWRSYDRYKAHIDDDTRNIHLDLIYKRKIAGSAAGKGTSTDITVQCTGTRAWKSTFQGKLIRALCDNAVGSGYSEDFGGDYINMVLSGDRVFVVYEGIAVFDVNTGTKLWETTFDNADFDFGIAKSKQILGKAAMPLVASDGVYIADLSKGNYKIKKMNLDNGSVVWESPKFDNSDIIPQLEIVGTTLIAKFGGEIETQTMIMDINTGNVSACKDEYKMTGSFGVKALDTKSGSLLWETSKMKTLGDKFSGSISNIFVSGNNVIFSSNKNVFCMDAATGNVVWKTDISKSGIGAVNSLWQRNDALITEGMTGIVSVNIADGKLNWAAKTKKNFGTFGTTNAYYVWVGKSPFDWQDFVRVDLDNGALLGIQKSTKFPQWTPDKEEFLKYDGNKIFRFKTRS